MTTCFAVLKCGNCSAVTTPNFDLAEASEARQQRAMEEQATELWSTFTCASCDYDRAYVLAFGPKAPADAA